MIEKRKTKLNTYFDEQIALCGERNKALLADDRADEADFEKVKANVYDIFRTILSVAVKTCNGEPEETKRFFLTKVELIPSNWAEAYNKAKQYNDAVKMKIEKIKLDTIEEIKDTFVKVWEEEV